MNLIAWIILGAIAGYLAGFLVRGDEGLGVIGHIVLGIVGAVIGGFLASALFNVKNPIQGALDLSTIVISVIGAILVVVVVSLVTGSRRVGQRPRLIEPTGGGRTSAVRPGKRSPVEDRQPHRGAAGLLRVRRPPGAAAHRHRPIAMGVIRPDGSCTPAAASRSRSSRP